ncbi:GIY-YIG nuclease family protein [Pedobacter insulae]|uniref:Putative endonuclease n=1 Tax=Pedobacter insulae TaxID=414048 RepID=A0A1I2TDK4_9SPHI|nr:GIY-YIG nuclease family protein [Pedobacter insulae]SFG62875.1 putative endonuclease [Pedobacter insulae]
MRIGKGGCVYIMTNVNHTVLYTGVSSDLESRVWEHKNHQHPKSFSAKYRCHKLVYFYFFIHIEEAIDEEKRIKGGSRKAKEKLINALNPEWLDLYESLFD